MSASSTTAPKAPKPHSTKEYNSNPFTLTFEALGRFFNTNVNWAIALIVIAVIGFIGQAGNDLFRYITHNSSTRQSTGLSTLTNTAGTDFTVMLAIAIVVFVIFAVAFMATLVIGTFIQGMFSYVALQSEAGKTVGFSEAFNATAKRFWRLLLAQLLASLKIFGWTLLLIVPGIVASYRYQLLPYLIMNESEEEKGIGDSHDKTKALVKGRLWELFGISFVAGIVPFVGTILGLSGKASLYNQLQTTKSTPEIRPKIHWLNYLGLMLLGAFLMFSGFVALLIIFIMVVK